MVAGHLRVVAPLGFGQRHIAGLIAQFRQRSAGITASLTLSDGPPRLSSDDWDVMVHIGELRDSTLVAIRWRRTAASSAPRPLIWRVTARRLPEDLREHDCIALRENDEDVTLWRFKKGGGPAVGVRIAPVLSSNTGAAALQWALDGQGIVARSEWDVADHVRARRLVPLLAGWALPPANVVALVKSRQDLPARTAGFRVSERGLRRAPGATSPRGAASA